MQFFKVKTVEETRNLINEKITKINDTEKVTLESALNRVLAEQIISSENVPSFSRSTVDGYAVRAKDTYGASESMPSFLNVTGEVKMGEEATRPLQDGEAIYIPTGGMLPPGANSVIMIEHCEDLNGLLNIYRQVAPGENVISKGEDVEKDALILSTGTKLRPQELGALASVGVTEVNVYRKIRIGYLSSGDEIVPHHTPKLSVGQIRDINVLTIAGLVQDWGYEFIHGGIVADDYHAFKTKAKELYNTVDCLIMSGGSSVGAKDFTTEVIESLGEPGVFVHGVSVKPGKPTILSVANGKPVIGLPGHPASAMIIFKLFGEQILQQLSGEKSKKLPNRIYAKITKNIPSSPGRSDYIRVKLKEGQDGWIADPIIGKSGLISTLVESDGIVEVSSEKEGIIQGELVPIILFR